MLTAKDRLGFFFCFRSFIHSLFLVFLPVCVHALLFYPLLTLPTSLSTMSSPSMQPWQLCGVQALFDLQSRTQDESYPLATTRTSHQELDRALTDTLCLCCCCCLALKAHCLLLLMLLILCASPQLRVGITGSAHLTQSSESGSLVEFKMLKLSLCDLFLVSHGVVTHWCFWH